MPAFQETEEGAEPEGRQVQAWRANTDQAGTLAVTAPVLLLAAANAGPVVHSLRF